MKKYLIIGIIIYLSVVGVSILQPKSIPQEQIFGGTSTITDTFDTYSTGDLNGNGDWSGYVGFDVQTSVVQSGVNAISVTGVSANEHIDKTIDAESGSQVYYMRSPVNNVYSGRVSGYGAGGVYLWNVALYSDGNIKYYGVETWETIQAYSADTWYKIEVQWDCGTDLIRYRVDDGTWTNWVGFIVGRTDTAVANIQMYVPTENTGTTIYFDSFSDPNAAPPTIPKKVLPPIIIEEI